MKKQLLVIGMTLTCLILIQSCKKDISVKQAISDRPQKVSATTKSQIAFAKTLAKAIKNDVETRVFLKNESLKQFDNDHDVLYQMIKDTKINGTETLHERLLHFAESKEEFEGIEKQLPLLTIFIPTLPNFNPENWNANTDVPLVAVSNPTKGNVLFYDYKSNETVLPASEIPGFPVLLIKQNERVVTGEKSKVAINSLGSYSELSTIHETADFVFKFADEAFNNINPKIKVNKIDVNRVTTTAGIDPINIAAYNSGNDWHRDYVYYGITASTPNGELKNNYSEFITSMKFLTPSALSLIADQPEDPRANSAYGTNVQMLNENGQYVTVPPTPWTEGNFEFRITVLINSKNGLGNEITKVVSVRPTDLFDLQYEKIIDFKPTNLLCYVLRTVTPKEYPLNVELLPWDLQNYGTAWKFIVYEYDNSQEVTQSYENTSTFAANFEVNLGITQKIGVKFGASSTTVEKRTFNVKTTLTSDFLGEATLSFDQPVITSFDGINYNTREITTGNVLSLSVEPKRVF